MVIAGFVVAALCILFGAYFFSAGVLFENACALGDAASCVLLAKTLRAAYVAGGLGAVIGLSALVVGAMTRRGRRQARSTRPSAS
jgi:hypothetical protein